ncbi:unnamed protein product [Mytilus edulis]|uniref:Uncharacterized protein n=1 Tax=Mytilus edulis TaxID=6550 RepID=A0A8S3VE76_MYTED|nr:unnamed protein product [Mytilus edulis]
MIYLYEDLGTKTGKKPCKIHIFRDIFCTAYNLVFHRPKKDQFYLYRILQRGELDDDDEEQCVRHQSNKESSRNQRSKDKQRAKTDNCFAAPTFDLEAVLHTPCSMVGDLYYKRCLSTYNFCFYSHGDGKGTCYLWDEVNGERGSNEWIMHPNAYKFGCRKEHSFEGNNILLRHL